MKILKVLVTAFLLLCAVLFIYAKLNHVAPLNMADKSAFNSYSGVAIKGYDPVAYFIEGAMKGSEKFSIEWQGSQWYFVSQDNLDLFLTNPEKYVPQLGGYCAFAVTTGFTATVDPRSFLIKNDELFLFNGEDLKMSFMVNTDKSIQTAKSKWSE